MPTRRGTAAGFLFGHDRLHENDRDYSDGTEAKPRAFTINLDPGHSTVLDIPFERPFYAGDYAGTIDIQAPGPADSVKFNVTIRTRLPIGSVWAALLFVLIVLLGAFLSRIFERYVPSTWTKIRKSAHSHLTAISNAVGRWTFSSKRPVRISAERYRGRPTGNGTTESVIALPTGS